MARKIRTEPVGTMMSLQDIHSGANAPLLADIIPALKYFSQNAAFEGSTVQSLMPHVAERSISEKAVALSGLTHAELAQVRTQPSADASLNNGGITR